MKIKEMSIKLVVSFLVLAMMILPTMVFAGEFERDELDKPQTASENKVENKVEDKETVTNDAVDNKEFERDELDKEEEKIETENYIKDAKQIKLLDKIKFTGKLYKTFKCESEKGTYTEQAAVVTEIISRDEGILGVTFTKDGKMLSTFGYIKVDQSKVLENGKLITLDFQILKGESGSIEINGVKYDVDDSSVIQLANGGIKINDKFIALKEGDEVKLVDLKGSFCLQNAGDNMLDRFIINGDTTFKIKSNGFVVKGNAIVNGEPVEGEVEVTYSDGNVSLKIVQAEIDGKELKTENFKTIVGNIISKIIDAIKNIFSKIMKKFF